VFALASPWLTAIVAGLALGFTDPFTPLWFGALLLGFAGAGGLLLGCILHVARVYLVRFDRFPFVGVDASRREAIRGGAAALLGGGAIVASFAAGRLPFGESWPPYHGREPVVYERDDLRMVAKGDPVGLGEPIAFEITNTGETESIPLGCHVPWALQAYEEGWWYHVTWTSGRYYSLCATMLEPGDTATVRVPISKSALAEEPRVSELDRELVSGTYRLVLVGTHPYLAVNFQVLPRP
jgi:hypothetical protein